MSFQLMRQGGLEVIDCNNHAKSAINYFGPSCAVNTLTDRFNPLGDNSDHLCKLCIGEIPGGRCTESDPYAGYEGAFRCLLEVGEIAFLVHTTVHEMTSTNFDLSTLKIHFEFIAEFTYSLGWISGCLWVPMGVYEYLWVFMSIHGCLCVSVGLWVFMGVMGINGCLWVSMDVYGYLRVSIGVYGFLWVFFRFLGVWVFMGIYESMDVYGYLRVSMNIYGVLWVFMGFYEFLSFYGYL